MVQWGGLRKTHFVVPREELKEIVTYPSYSTLAFGSKQFCFVSTMPPKLTYPIEQVDAFFNAIQRSPLAHVPHRM